MKSKLLDKNSDKIWRKIIPLALGILLAAHNGNTFAQNEKNFRPVSINSDHIYGSEFAPVSIILYSDFDCPYCRNLRTSLKRLVNESDGKVNWVFRHFPLDGNIPDTQIQAEATECAAKISGNDGFWALANALFITPRRTKPSTQTIISRAAKMAQLNEAVLNKCIKMGKLVNNVSEDKLEAKALGFSGTPGLVFIHNKSGKKEIKQGALSLTQLRQQTQALYKL
jgi:protein-disulfide isomerase